MRESSQNETAVELKSKSLRYRLHSSTWGRTQPLWPVPCTAYLQLQYDNDIMLRNWYKGTLRLNDSIEHEIDLFEFPGQTSLLWTSLQAVHENHHRFDIPVAFYSKTLLKLRAPREVVFDGEAPTGTPKLLEFVGVLDV